MANIVPEISPNETASPAERKVYDALRSLPDEYRVFHSVTYYLWPESGAAPNEGEADFVLLHPSNGLLAIEVKGGGIRFEGREGRWYSKDRKGFEHAIDDPFRQAQRHRWALAGAIEKELGTRIASGHAVCFPDCTFDLPAEKQPAGQPRELVLDARSLGDFRAAVKAVFAFSRPGAAAFSLTQKQLKKIAQNVLAPRFALTLPLKTAIAGEEGAFLLLASEQITCLDFLELNRRAAVEGGAGTGKTLVALEAARRAAYRDERVLILGFNRPLVALLKERTRSGADEPAIRVATFHELCRDFALRADLPWPETDPTAKAEAEAFYNQSAPEMLSEALDVLPDRYDTILVDEAQDFRANWWPMIEKMLASRTSGRLAIFLDPAQDLWERGSELPGGLARFPLRVNQRNTLAIAREFAPLGGGGLRLASLAPEGEPPVRRTYSSVEEEREQVEVQVEHVLGHEGLDPTDIVILGTRQIDRSFLSSNRSLCGFPVTSIDDDGHVAAGAIPYATARRFKGLEAKVVFLCDLDGEGYADTARDRYVAMSRARHRLYIFSKRDT